jgi:hypothetical protein
MATSVFFNNFGASMEQGLIEDLIIESIKIYGIDVYYIKRTKNNIDEVYREASYFTYGSAILIDVYIKNVNGFEGDGEFLSKFGIEVRDQVTFTVAKRTFAEEVGDYINEVRPLEGDLIWFPLTQALYQVKLADVKPIFYQLGALQTYDLTCELYEAESAVFSTGIPVIDDTYNDFSMSPDAYEILAENGYTLTTESEETIILESYSVDDIDVESQNDTFEQEGLDFIDFTEFDPFSESGVRS